MKMMMTVRLPVEKFNAAVKDGTAGQKLSRILEDIKPEAVYFSTVDGQRGGILIVNMADPSQIPSLAEPWFLTFDADVEFRACMTPEELGRAGLEDLGTKWS